MDDSDLDELRPIIAGKYAIEWEVDHGAMGRVFAATQLGLERAVAVKIMSEQGRGFRERFLVEARALASLNHRNIVTIYDSGEMPDGLVFIVMEYLRGQTLADALKRERRFDVVRTLQVAVQMTRGLRAAHRQSIVHRDLKPSNVFLVEDDDADDPSDGITVGNGVVVKLFDFGIAKTLPMSRDHVVTREGAIVGTPAYMAPEQVEGRAVDARSDLYSLGCVLYQLLTGRTPFVASNNVELMLSHLRKLPPKLRTLRPDVPTPVEDVVMRLLAKDPRERYADADALLPVLKELLVVFGGDAFRRQSTDVFGQDVPPPVPPAPPRRASNSNSNSSSSNTSDALPYLEPLPRTFSPSPRTPLHLPNVTLPLADVAHTHPESTSTLPFPIPVVVGALLDAAAAVPVHVAQHAHHAAAHAATHAANAANAARQHKGPAMFATFAVAVAAFASIAMWGDDVWSHVMHASRIIGAFFTSP